MTDKETKVQGDQVTCSRLRKATGTKLASIGLQGLLWRQTTSLRLHSLVASSRVSGCFLSPNAREGHDGLSLRDNFSPLGLGVHPWIRQLWLEGCGHVVPTWQLKPHEDGRHFLEREKGNQTFLGCTPFDAEIVSGLSLESQGIHFTACLSPAELGVDIGGLPWQASPPTSGINLPAAGSTRSTLCLPVGGVWKLVWQDYAARICVSTMLVSPPPPFLLLKPL